MAVLYLSLQSAFFVIYWPEGTSRTLWERWKVEQPLSCAPLLKERSCHFIREISVCSMYAYRLVLKITLSSLQQLLKKFILNFVKFIHKYQFRFYS